MKCTDFQTRIPELLDGSADLSDDMKRHLAQCPVCTAEYETARRTLDAVTPRCRVRPSDGFRERLLGTLSRAERNRRSRRRTLRIVTATLSAAAIVALILLPGFRTPVQAARGCFRNAAAALDKARTLRMELRIRTQPQENFSFTDPEGEFVPHVVQAVYAPVLRWRVEKPDRKALFDGRRTLLWQPSLQEGLELPAGTCVLEELGMLLDPRMLFATEERAAEIAGGTYTLTEERDTIRLNVTAPARGDFSESRYMLNSSITQSNTRREYLFDRKSGHLLKARIVALTGAGERTLLETDRIDYDLPIDTVQLTTPPAGIAWLDRTQPLAGEKLAGITAEEAARRILQAMTVWDEAIIDEAFSFYGAKLRGMLRKDYEGAADFEVGAPFRSGAYPGYFVPCVFRMPDGSTRQLRLALRNDNPSGSWIVDGGI